MKLLYLECNMGAAGDMLMSALYELLDHGQKAQFLRTMNGLGLGGVELTPLSARTCGIVGTRMQVTVHGTEEGTDLPHGHKHAHDCHAHSHSHSAPGHIASLIDSLSLPEEVRSHARGVYDAIAAAEAEAHGCPVEQVHFHEVGALDAVADVTGVCYAIHLLGPDKITASPVHVGAGQVRCAHGVVPVPAPATAALLRGIPSYSGDIQGELCTPTGAALLAHFAARFGPMPVMAAENIGYGVGKKEFPAANCVRAFLGDAQDGADGEILELVCNIDDMTGEALAFACGQLLDAGVLDAYAVPGTMKKGRPGQVLTVLCAPERKDALIRAIFAHTTTNGLRARRCAKYFLRPRTETAQTPYGPIRIKRAEGYGASHSKPEYEDAAAAARRLGLPFRTVWEEVLRCACRDGEP